MRRSDYITQQKIDKIIDKYKYVINRFSFHWCNSGMKLLDNIMCPIVDKFEIQYMENSTAFRPSLSHKLNPTVLYNIVMFFF